VTLPLLSIENLRVSFDTGAGVVLAVDGVSLAVEPGTVLGIVGESGAGKSVLARTVLGLLDAPHVSATGRILFGGHDLLAMGDELRRLRGSEVSIVLQDPTSRVDPFHTVGKQLIEVILAHRPVSRAAARDRAIDLLALVGIPDPHRHINTYPHQLGPGMAQRVAFALAVAGAPKLLIADEPTAALDVAAQGQILALLADLRRRLGLAMVVLTRELAVAADIADEIAVMYAGQVLERAPTPQLLAAPEHPYTWGLLTSVPGLATRRDDVLVPVPGSPPKPTQRPSGCCFHPRCAYVRDQHRRLVPRLVAAPAEQGHEVACLLPPPLRRQLWEGLRAGQTPAQLRVLVDAPAVDGAA
jgi:peptide/nickel transport system ATP-binding protein